jgi:type II secretory pathway pseudopilin PulG
MTLIELLITVLIMGVVGIGMGGTMVAITANSSTTRDASVGTTELRRIADKVRALPYEICGSVVNYTHAVDATPDALSGPGNTTVDPLPVGVTYQITKVEYWQPDAAHPGQVSDAQFVSAADYRDPASSNATCTDRLVDNPDFDAGQPESADNPKKTLAPKVDSFLQRVTITVNTGTFEGTLVVIKREFQ